MKFKLIFAMAILALAVSVYAQDCNNPLLDKANNPNAPETGVLKEPATDTSDTRLKGKQSCCTKETWDEVKQKFKGKKDKQEKQKLDYEKAADKSSEVMRKKKSSFQKKQKEVADKGTEWANKEPKAKDFDSKCGSGLDVNKEKTKGSLDKANKDIEESTKKSNEEFAKFEQEVKAARRRLLQEKTAGTKDVSAGKTGGAGSKTGQKPSGSTGSKTGQKPSGTTGSKTGEKPSGTAGSKTGEKPSGTDKTGAKGTGETDKAALLEAAKKQKYSSEGKSKTKQDNDKKLDDTLKSLKGGLGGTKTFGSEQAKASGTLEAFSAPTKKTAMKSEVNSCVSSQSAGKASLGDALEEFNKSEKQRKGKDSKEKMGKISNEDLDIMKKCSKQADKQADDALFNKMATSITYQLKALQGAINEEGDTTKVEALQTIYDTLMADIKGKLEACKTLREKVTQDTITEQGAGCRFNGNLYSMASEAPKALIDGNEDFKKLLFGTNCAARMLEKEAEKQAAKHNAQTEHIKVVEETVKQVEDQRKKMNTAQVKCQKRLAKYEAGMLNAACDPNYKDWAKKGTDGNWEIQVKDSTCKNLQNDCYDFVNEKATMGEVTIAAEKAKNLIEKSEEIDGLLEKISDAETDALKKEFEDQVKKITAEAEKVTGLNSEQDGAPLVVAKPANCNSKEDCKFICEQFVGFGGVDEEALEMKGSKVADVTTVKVDASFGVDIEEVTKSLTEDGAVKTVDARRLLATSGAKVTYTTSGGYEPDSTENAGGYDTETFTEEPLAAENAAAGKTDASYNYNPATQSSTNGYSLMVSTFSLVLASILLM